MKLSKMTLLATIALAAATAFSLLGTAAVHAAGGKVTDPAGTAPDRYVY